MQNYPGERARVSGAAALAGTSFPIDRQASAAARGFDRVSSNEIFMMDLKIDAQSIGNVAIVRFVGLVFKYSKTINI